MGHFVFKAAFFLSRQSPRGTDEGDSGEETAGRLKYEKCISKYVKLSATKKDEENEKRAKKKG